MKQKILLGPLKPFYNGKNRIGFYYLGDSIRPPRDRRGKTNLWLERSRILGAFIDCEGRYYVVYETDKIDYYRPASTKLPLDAKPVDEIYYTVIREKAYLPEELGHIDIHEGAKCEEYYDSWGELEEVVCRFEEKVTVWRGRPYTARDFIEDDRYSRSRILRDVEEKYGKLKDLGEHAWCEVIGDELDEIKSEGYRLRIVKGVVIEPPNTEANIDCYSIVAAGIVVEEMRWDPDAKPTEYLFAEKWKRYYVVVDSSAFLEEVRNHVDDIKNVVKGERVWISKDLEDIFGRNVIENAKKILDSAGIKVE